MPFPSAGGASPSLWVTVIALSSGDPEPGFRKATCLPSVGNPIGVVEPALWAGEAGGAGRLNAEFPTTSLISTKNIPDFRGEERIGRWIVVGRQGITGVVARGETLACNCRLGLLLLPLVRAVHVPSSECFRSELASTRETWGTWLLLERRFVSRAGELRDMELRA